MQPPVSSCIRQGGLTAVLFVLICSWSQAQGSFTLRAEGFLDNVREPVVVTHAGDGSGRLFLVEQRGRIRIVENGRLLDRPFLDIRTDVLCCGELGMLGLAFHPEYPRDGRFFVYYSNRQGNTRIVSYRVSETDPNRADRRTRRPLFAAAQFDVQHQGGQLAFGPDGMLYVGLGDGGGSGDPMRNGQDLTTPHGSILRVDIAAEGSFTAPPDNPFVGQAGVAEEIWAYGLRNPWRFSFDRRTGDLLIGDVGEGATEEINFQPASSGGGENYGWNVLEGPDCFDAQTCDRTGKTEPIISYSHDEGIAVVGGYRYRGRCSSSIQGVYVFGDFGSGTVWGATETGNNSWQRQALFNTGFLISAFGEDEAGELYITDYEGGRVLRLVAPDTDPSCSMPKPPPLPPPTDCDLPPGHPAFCRDCGPCADGEGDCDRDSDCASGLICADNVGADFGFAPGIDVCTSLTSTCPWPPGHPRLCADCGPCANGEGDCDGDGQCVPGTRCIDNVGADFGFAPGIDMCLAEAPPPGGCNLPAGHPDFCADCGPCGVGQGDCDRDLDCAPGLDCVDDIGPQFGFGARVDVCMPP